MKAKQSSTKASKAPSGKRTSKAGSDLNEQEDGRTKILNAALELFSTKGFDGTSLRDIANEAGVMHQLVVYHFKTKEALWRDTIDRLMDGAYPDGIDKHIEDIRRMASEEGIVTALRASWRAFVLFTAHNPQLHRIVTFDGRSENSRFYWLLDSYVQPLYKFGVSLMRRAQKEGKMRPGNPGRLYYACIGLVTTSFVFDKQYGAMTKLNPFSEKDVDEVTQLTYDLLGI